MDTPGILDNRICFFIGSLGRGGAERVFTVIANSIAERGYEVDFVVGTDSLGRKDELNKEVNHIFFREPRLLQAVVPFLKYLRKRKPDVVLSTLHHWNFLAILTNKLAGGPSSVVIRVPNDLTVQEFSEKRLRDRLTAPLASILYPQADRVICVSEEMKQGLKSRFDVPSSKLCTIPNPVNRSEIRRKSRAYTPDHEFFSSSAPVVLSVGKLEPQKDQKTLLNAFKLLLEKRNARLMILGEGSKRTELERIIRKEGIRDRVDLPGEVTNPYPYFAQSDLFVLSSKWEGMPNVLLEALALGKTIVSTDCRSGPSELLNGGEYGYLSPVGNTTRLADIISMALDHPLDPDILIERAGEYSVDRITDEYLRVLEGAIQ